MKGYLQENYTISAWGGQGSPRSQAVLPPTPDASVFLPRALRPLLASHFWATIALHPERRGHAMNHLWSPWRLEYLTASKIEGCIFCHAARQDDDRQNLLLLRGERAFLILNRFPYNNGHFMAVPYAHLPSLEDLDPATLTEMMLLLNRGLAALRASLTPEGFNIGANLGHVAGAGIDDHVHIHAVPRWLGDTNFMPIVGDMRVIPETWLQTFDRIKAALDQTGRPGERGETHP